MNALNIESQNKALIEKFYTAFQNRDGETMASSYSPTAHFEDAVFKLEGSKIGSMWKMLCINGHDLKITYSNISASKDSVTAQWVAEYTFSATGRKVVNKISAFFEIKDGLIVKHKDQFSFWKWASQALGPLGILLGWTQVVRGQVQRLAAKNLDRFISET